MKNMKDKLVNLGERVANNFGNMAISVGEKSKNSCPFLCLYEPKIPMELLEENLKK